MVSEMLKRGKRALIITDRVELLTETGGTLQEFGIRAAEITAGMKTPPSDPVVIAMSQTLRRRITKWNEFFQSFNVVIIDEAHIQEFDAYRDVWPSNTYVLGATATPMRWGKMRPLADMYDGIVVGPQVPELIRDGYLVPDRYFGVKMADMSGVRMSNLGDYAENEMFQRYDKKELYTGAVDNWLRLVPDTMTLGFCVNIIHTVKTCEAFNRVGITARFLTSDPAPENPDYEYWVDKKRIWSGDRAQIIEDWKAGKFPILLNAGILTKGFNVRNIETILVNRATVSVPLWLQILGRGSRIYPGKTHFNILDFGDNGRRLGYYNQQREWNLNHKQSRGDGAPPVKECKGKPDKNGLVGCGALIFASQMVCPFCGYEFQKEKKEIFAELVEVNYTDIIPAKNNYTELERRAEERGYKHGWVITQIIVKDGRDGLREYAMQKGYKNGWLWGIEKRYEKIIRESEKKLKNMGK
jgi:superfamily II DNA or RNA helicase